MNNVLALKSVMSNTSLPVLPPGEDELSEHLIPEVVVIVDSMAQALRLAWAAAMPNTFPVMPLPLAFPHGLFGKIDLIIEVSRCLTDHDQVVATVSCPDQPDAILERRYNLLAALAEYYGDSTVGRPDVKEDGRLVFIWPGKDED